MNKRTAGNPWFVLLPWSLVFLRLVLGPTIVWAAEAFHSGYVLSAIVLVALLSDIFGRCYRAQTWVRLASDTGIRFTRRHVFYFGVLAALWIRKPDVVRWEWPLLAAVLALECVRYVVDLLKFGRSASYHSYLAKAWGLTMAVALIALFAVDAGKVLLAIALGLGVLCNLEGLAMSALLPRWQHDIKTIPRSIALRREMLRTN